MSGLAIDVLLPKARPRKWQLLLVEALRAAGHTPRLRDGRESGTAMLDAILALEAIRFGKGLASRGTPLDLSARPGPADLLIDLTGERPASDAPALSLLFDGHPSPAAAARTIASGGLPMLTAMLDGRQVAQARPMVNERLWLSRGLDDVLARAVTLAERCVRRFAEGRLTEEEQQPLPVASPAGLGAAYALGIVPKLCRRLWQKAFYRPFHWRVGYRFLDGLGLSSNAGGPPWQELPDDGLRFYADPFPFEHDGRHFLFVEEFPHETGKGVISVAVADMEGRFATPRPVLEEPFHLSYPQVFAHGGEIWMIPETMAARQVILYRAERFPDRWVRECVLVDGRALSDATLLEHGGRFWLFAADRGEQGSASDCLVVHHADTLHGPFAPHRDNPVVFDRTCGRPGGAFIRDGARLMLPVQDGTLGYGGGLGLLAIEGLDTDAVRLGPLQPLRADGWLHPRMHTYNRAGRLEAIDGFVQRRRI